jgi:UDP-2,4-diacetamido-2,4,6-trideoxy-beta-L-altropyranose hydrolase
VNEHGIVVVRADASEEIGIGHVVRSLALGKELRARGWTVVLVTRELPTDLLERVRTASVEIEFLEQPPCHTDEATQIIGLDPELVVSDSYRLQSHFFEALRGSGTLLCLVDDNGENDHSLVDVVVNQNPSARFVGYGPGSRGPQLLLGLGYALVRDEIVAERREPAALRGDSTVFVSMGGSDPLHLCEPLVEYFGHLAIPTAVAVGPATADRRALVQRLERAAHVTVVPEAEFARSLATAQVAVIGAGTTMWEAACLGVPSFSVVVAGNQTRPSSAAESLGFTRCVNGRSPKAVDAIGEGVVHLLNDHASQHDMSSKGRSAVDGAGAARVATFLSDLASDRRGVPTARR